MTTHRIGEEVRSRITEAALRLFSQQGYEHTSVVAIAQEAGLSRATIYRHFSGKREILIELLRTWLDVMEYIRRTGEPKGRSSWELLKAGGEEVIRALLAAPVLLNAELLFLRLSVIDPEARAGLAQAFEAARHAARDLAALSPEEADVELMGVLVVAVIEGLLIQHLVDPERIDPEELWPRLMDLCRSGSAS